jgi:hypothetical protein
MSLVVRNMVFKVSKLVVMRNIHKEGGDRVRVKLYIAFIDLDYHS